MAAAYLAVDGGHVSQSKELNLIAHIHQYGYQAIYDRPLRYGEIQAFNLAQNIRSAYQARSNAETWAKWAEENEQESKLLNAAMMAAMGDDG